jgi:large subunit ribosomal protein L31e
MALERTYTIPLRSEWLKSVKYKRAKKAVRAIKEFLIRHMKAADMDSVKIGKYLNLDLWKHSIKRPPSKVRVIATKDDKGIVWAELVGAPKDEKKAEAPKKGAKPAEKKEAPAAKPAEKKAEPTKEAPKPAAKPAAAVAPKPAPAPVAKQPSAPKQVGQIIR